MRGRDGVPCQITCPSAWKAACKSGLPGQAFPTSALWTSEPISLGWGTVLCVGGRSAAPLTCICLDVSNNYHPPFLRVVTTSDIFRHCQVSCRGQKHPGWRPSILELCTPCAILVLDPGSWKVASPLLCGARMVPHTSSSSRLMTLYQ